MARQHKTRRRQARLSHVVFLAATASARTFITFRTPAMSLANFQVIASNAIPSQCISAYNQQMASCSTNDFNNSICSSDCIQELQQMQANVQRACQGVQIASNTLLGQALLGNLIPLLCPNVQPATTTVRQTLTVPPAPPARQTITPIVAPPPQQVTSQRAPAPKPPPPPPPQDPDTASSSSDGPDATPTDTPLAGETSAPIEPPPEPVQTTPRAVSRTRSTETPKATPASGSGPPTSQNPGGSPFDVPPDEKLAGAGTVRVEWTAMAAAAVGVGIVLLR